MLDVSRQRPQGAISVLARSHELVHGAQPFALNILSDAQMELGKTFAYDRAARNSPRAQAPSTLTEHGELLFPNALANLECRVVAEYPGGDHTIFLGEVVSAALDTGENPTLYFESPWRTLHK